MRKASIDQVIREHLTDQLSDSRLVGAVMHMHGWIDGAEHGPSDIARRSGLDVEQLRQYRDLADVGLRDKNNPPLNEALEFVSSHLPLPHDEIGYYLECELGVLDNSNFRVLSLINAADAYGIRPAFESVSKDLHRWLVDVSDTSIIDFADRWIVDLVKQAERDCIVHLGQMEKLLARVTGDFSLEQFWQVIHACPRLSTGTFPYVFARQPDPKQYLVKRIDRLLSWCYPHKIPVDVAFRQIFRDQFKIDILEDPDVGITRQQAFTGFLIQCAYYDVWLKGVSLVNPVPVDTVLSPTEKRVVEHLIGMEGGIDIDDLEGFARFIGCSESEVQRILLTSPIVFTEDGLVYRAFDRAEIEEVASPWDDVNRFPFWQVWMTPAPGLAHEQRPQTTDELVVKLQDQVAQHDAIDLASLSRKSWLGAYSGQLGEALLAQLEANNQTWTPVIDPATRRCVGVVKTSRLRNKLVSGNQHIGLDDAKMRGIELNRQISRQELNEAFATSFCVYFNDAPGSWGVVFHGDL